MNGVHCYHSAIGLDGGAVSLYGILYGYLSFMRPGQALKMLDIFLKLGQLMD